ncbi:hypothetical protein [Amycolatopsis sp. RTGN1]|uniref:hypothetical protein n=1 Tax=Amycolatopsis ponsaeliensis TaxID=2992142 RepID=UPI00254AAA47|nr:hypothetical protein [Amycolatopsis sp. RTGN1]
MIVLSKDEQAAVKWLAGHGVRVTEPTTLLTTRLSVRRGRPAPEAFTAVFVLGAVTFTGMFGYQMLRLLPGVDRSSDLPAGGFWSLFAAWVSLRTWLHARAADRRAAARLGDRRLDRPRPPWREVVNGWYLATLLITFGGGGVLGIVLAASGSVWALIWLGVLALGAVVDAVILTSVLRRPVLAEDEGSLAVDAVARLQDVQVVMPSFFAVLVVPDLAFGDAPAWPWLTGYVVLAVGAHVVAAFTQRRRTPALPADGYYGEAA